MTEPSFDFNQTFAALTGFAPFPWQRRLYDRIVAGDWPDALDIPTGLGKTSVIQVWLLALASGGASGGVPRRLVYVVNRRTIVDQATDEAKKLRDQLTGEITDSLLSKLRDRLLHVAGHEPPAVQEARNDCLSISTLRGQLADNQQWMRDAARPAIVIGTVDMIGSRLLFGAYRSSWKQRAMQAGLIGRDALIIHDEAHLTQPFQKLLAWVRDEQQRHPFNERRLRILAMSATSSVDNMDESSPPVVFALNDADRAEPMVKQRLHAATRLQLHPTGKRGQITRLADLAASHEHEVRRVIVYVRKPADAAEVVAALTGKTHGIDDKRIALLTGTIRGFERDALAASQVLKALSDRQQPIDKTHYLISTSAGEVGADFDADHLVCDATALDSLVQRLGRVNRRGIAEQPAHVDLVHDPKPPANLKPDTFEAATFQTLHLLDTMAQEDGRRNVSPAALRQFVDDLDEDARRAAVSPIRPWAAPHEVVLDAWSLTSIRDEWPLAHDITPYLHGIEEGQPPETIVAWRKELDVILQENVADQRTVLERVLLTHHRLRTHELLRVTNTDELVKLITKIQERRDAEEQVEHDGSCPSSFVAITQGKAKVQRLDDLPTAKAIQDAVRGAVVVLPSAFGGLNPKGMLDATLAGQPVSDIDVADHRDYQPEAPRCRLLIHHDADQAWRLSSLDGDTLITGGDEAESNPLQAALGHVERESGKPMRRVNLLKLMVDENGDPRISLLLLGPRQSNQAVGVRGVPLKEHVDDVSGHAQRAAKALWHDQTMQETYRMAGESHDTGKVATVWQQAVLNNNPDDPWGKPGRNGMDGRSLNGYRHEFRSLIDVLNDPHFATLDETTQSLVLHLIATHHGHGRPHFPDKAINHPANGPGPINDWLTPAAVARRFDRLQREYGHWGLAWLEAVFMSADIAASADAEEQEDA